MGNRHKGTTMSALPDIEARYRDCLTYNFGMRNADKLAHEDVRYLLAELRKAHEALERVEALHKPVTVYELDDVNGTWIYDGDEKRVLTTLCAECTPDFVLSEIEEGDYDGGGSDADIYWPCPTKAAVAAAKGDGQ
jgi:hypothetical protein